MCAFSRCGVSDATDSADTITHSVILAFLLFRTALVCPTHRRTGAFLRLQRCFPNLLHDNEYRAHENLCLCIYFLAQAVRPTKSGNEKETKCSTPVTLAQQACSWGASMGEQPLEQAKLQLHKIFQVCINSCTKYVLAIGSTIEKNAYKGLSLLNDCALFFGVCGSRS